MTRTKPVQRRTVLRQMLKLAAEPANDAVKLAYLTEAQRDVIDELALGCLTEFKRNANGTVEIKLTDRAAVLQKLLEQLGGDDDGTAAFLQALDRPPDPRVSDR